MPKNVEDIHTEAEDRLLTVLLDGVDSLDNAVQAHPSSKIERAVKAWVARAQHVMGDIYKESYLQVVRDSR